MALNKLKTTDVKTAEETVKETAPVVEKETVTQAEPQVDEPETNAQLDQQLDDSPADEQNDAGQQEEGGEGEGAVLEHKPEPEPEAAKPAEAAQAQQVALQSNNTAVASVDDQKKSAMQTFTQDAAAQGFEGLVLTGMSFDRLKLNDKEFQLGIDETSLGNRIEFALMATRPVYIIRQHDRKGAELFYSYDKDGKTNTDGTSAQDVLDQWAEDGYGGPNLAESGNEPLSVKEYIEATAQLKNRTDEHDEAVVMMSIPPASKQKLGGAVAVGQMKFRKQLGRTPGIGEMLYEAKVGPKVGSGEEAFNPWIFNAIGLLEQN